MDSTRTVLKQILATTNAHVELDHLVDYEEKYADVSITYKAYSDYDTVDISTDASVDKDDKIKVRHTHLPFTDSSTEFKEEMKNMVKYYIDNNLWPASNFFKGGPGGYGDDIEPIPDASIDSLADGPGADVVAPIPDASIDSLRD